MANCECSDLLTWNKRERSPAALLLPAECAGTRCCSHQTGNVADAPWFNSKHCEEMTCQNTCRRKELFRGIFSALFCIVEKCRCADICLWLCTCMLLSLSIGTFMVENSSEDTAKLKLWTFILKRHWYLEGFHTSLPVISIQSLSTPCGIQRSVCYSSSHFTLGTSIYGVAMSFQTSLPPPFGWPYHPAKQLRNETRVHLKWLGTIARAIADNNSTLELHKEKPYRTSQSLWNMVDNPT